MYLFNPLHARIIHVPSDSTTIQGGINGAVNGDTVMVAPGTYHEHDIDFLGKAITVMGTDPEDSAVVAATVVDAAGSGRLFIFQNGEDSTSILAGLAITGGYADRGGGIYCSNSSPMIISNIIHGNTADNYGAGILCSGSSPFIENNIIIQNISNHAGGGIGCSWGSSPTITRNKIYLNLAASYGGGIASGGPQTLSKIINNIISQNWAGDWGGGGIYFGDSTPPEATVMNNIITGNWSDTEGGGIFCYYSSPTITNTIIWNNSAPTSSEISLSSGSNPIIIYSDVQGGWSGEGNIDAGPLFADPTNDDYHLQSGSPCIDAGNPSILDACLPPGLGGTRSDMGAYGGEKNCGWPPDIGTYGTIYGWVRDSSNHNSISNATVTTTFGYNNSTDNYGYYIIWVPAGRGYTVSAYTSGYELSDTSNVEVLQGQSVNIDFLLNQKSGDRYVISELSPNPNPVTSTIETGGQLFRHYSVVDSVTGEPAPGVIIRLNNNETDTSDIDGLLRIDLHSNQIGGGSPGDSAVFSIIEVGGYSIPPEDQISFTCKVVDRRAEKYWESSAFTRLGLSFWRLELERGSRVGLIDLGQETPGVDSLLCIRQGRAGGGVEFTIESPANINVGPVQFEAGVGTEGVLSVVTEDRYMFENLDIDEQEAMAQYLLFADGNFGSLSSQVLIQIFTFLELFFTGQSTLDNAYVGDLIGIDGRASVSATAAVGMGVSDDIEFEVGGGISGSGEGHVIFNTIYNRPLNSVQRDFGVTGKVTGYSGGGLHFGDPFQENEHTQNLPWRLYLGISGSGLWGYKLAFIEDQSTGIIDKAILQSRFRGTLGSDGQELTTTYLIEGEDFVNALASILLSPANELYNSFWQSTRMLVEGASFSTIYYNGFQGFGGIQDFNPVNIGVRYVEEESQIRDIFVFDVDVSISSGTSVLGAVVGGGVGFSEYISGVTEKGAWYKGHDLPLERYDSPVEITTTYEEVVQRIIDNLPQSFLDLMFWIDLFTFNSLGVVTVTDTFYVGDEGSYMMVNSSSFPTGFSTLTAASWGWWGSSPAAKASTLSRRELEIRQSIKQRAEESFGMEYGIGGFYQFEPESTILLNDSTTLTIVYSDSEVIGINETELGMYWEDKENHDFLYVGGVVDTASNHVTANINRLGLYTLAPKLPRGEFTLYPEPDSLLADSLSISLITSGTIYNNDNTVVIDGTPFTVTSNAGFIVSEDQDTTLEGIQVTSSGGTISFELLSGKIAYNATVQARSVYGTASAETQVAFYDSVPPPTPTAYFVSSQEYSIGIRWVEDDVVDLGGFTVYYDSDQPDHPYDGEATIFGSPSPIDVGDATNILLTGLEDSLVYYIAVRAYDVSGNLSDYSNELTLQPGLGIEIDLDPFQAETYQGGSLDFSLSISTEDDPPVHAEYFIKLYDVYGREIITSKDYSVDLSGTDVTVRNHYLKIPDNLRPGTYNLTVHLRSTDLHWDAVTSRIFRIKSNAFVVLPEWRISEEELESTRDISRTDAIFPDRTITKRDTFVSSEIRATQANTGDEAIVKGKSRLRSRATNQIGDDSVVKEKRLILIDRSRKSRKKQVLEVESGQTEFQQSRIPIGASLELVYLRETIAEDMDDTIVDKFNRVQFEILDGVGDLVGASTVVFSRLDLGETRGIIMPTPKGLKSGKYWIEVSETGRDGHMRRIDKQQIELVEGVEVLPNDRGWNLDIASFRPAIDDEDTAIDEKTDRHGLSDSNLDEALTTLPKVFDLRQNFPNPFNPSTTIIFDIPESACDGVDVSITIYNLRGQLVRTLLDERKTCGTYAIQWDGKTDNGESVASGVYLYRIQASDFVETRRMVVLN